MITAEELCTLRPICEWCGIRKSTTRHHCLVRDMKRHHAELTVPENLMAACWHCHIEKELLDGREVAEWFWQVQCDRYGVAHMQDWLDGLDLKIKPKF